MVVTVEELKRNLTAYLELAERGERVEVRAHGRVVAALGPAVCTPLRFSNRQPEPAEEATACAAGLEGMLGPMQGGFFP